jgi:hypothetical protein
LSDLNKSGIFWKVLVAFFNIKIINQEGIMKLLNLSTIKRSIVWELKGNPALYGSPGFEAWRREYIRLPFIPQNAKIFMIIHASPWTRKKRFA